MLMLILSFGSSASFGQGVDSCNVAGFDGFIQVCPDEAFNLFSGLSGPWDSTGVWYTPSNDPGPYYYPNGLSISGQYPFEYHNQHPGCPIDTAVVIVEVLQASACNGIGISEIGIDGLTLRGNPVHDVLVMSYQGPHNDLHFTLFGLDGSVLFISERSINTIEEISIADLPKGMYYLHVYNSSVQQVFKVLKE